MKLEASDTAHGKARKAGHAPEQAIPWNDLEGVLAALNLHAIVSIADAAGRITYVNDKFCEISGYSREELCGQYHSVLKSGKHSDALYTELWDTLVDGRIWQGEICNLRKDGGAYWVECTIVPVLDEDGLPCQYVSIRTDITGIKEAELALAVSEERLRRSQDYANIGTWDWDIQTGGLYWSSRIAPLFGLPAGTVHASYEGFLAAVHPEDRDKVVAAIEACVRDGKEYDIEHRCVWPDGTVRWLQERGDVVRDEHGEPLKMLGVVQDITAHKEADASLRRSETILAEAQRVAGLGNWEYDLATGELRWSELIYTIYGLDPARFTPHVHTFYALAHPDDRGKLRQAEQAAILTGHSELTHRIVRPDGSIRFVHERAKATLDKNGEPIKLIGTVQDVTAAETAALALADAKATAERANQAKSDFLSSMSHELRTPMNAILGFGQLLEADDTLSAEQRDHAEEILKAGHHLLALINEVLDLAKIEAGKVEMSVETVEICGVVDECLSLVQPLISAHGLSVMRGGEPGLRVRADRTRLKQVLINLLSNAIKYNRKGGYVLVEVQALENQRVRLTVRDSGQGIAPDRMSELFLPFNRLDAEGGAVEGTGIGLTITQRIVEKMDGTIAASSELGVGSAFWVDLPGVYSAAARREPSRRNTCHASWDQLSGVLAGATGSPRTVLYMEDNPVNLRLVQHAFGGAPNLRLLTAEDPRKGLCIAEDLKPDLILLDIDMPEMDGYAVLDTLRANPALLAVPVVALTARTTVPDRARGKAAGFAEYLTKPIEIPELIQTIARLLAATPKHGSKPRNSRKARTHAAQC